MTGANGFAKLALECGEAKGVLPLVPEHEPHGRGAQSAGAVVQKEGFR
jgi:hypothetical protein